MKTIMKSTFLNVLILMCLLLIGISCNTEHTETDDDIQARQTEQSLAEANKDIGMPNITNFQERKIFKTILELRDKESLFTYCYLVNTMTGEVGQFLGKGVGYGIPASTQFTNPTKVGMFRSVENGRVPYLLPQADPNGLFMPTSSTATWYMLLDEKGDPHPVYIEPLIIVSPIKLH